jgi:O-antigen ligase
MVLLAVVLWRPIVALMLAAVAVPFGVLWGVPGVYGAITPAPLLVALATYAWLVGWLLRRSGLPRLGGALVTRPYNPEASIGLPLGALVAWMALTTLVAADLALALAELGKWVAMLAAFFVASRITRSGSARLGLLVAMLLAGLAETLVGIRMAVLGAGLGAFEILDGRLQRAIGTFGQPNPFGAYMNMLWPLALSVVGAVDTAWWRRRRVGTAAGRALTPGPSPRGRGEVNPLLHLLGPVALFVCLASWVALIMSWSRGAWLAAGAALAVLMAVAARQLVSSGRRLALVLLAVGVVGAAAIYAGQRPAPDRQAGVPGLGVALGALWARVGSAGLGLTLRDVSMADVTDENFATVERLAHWQAALRMLAVNPWTGVGVGNYEALYSEHRLPAWPYALGHAHNQYLNMAAELGLVGLAIFVWFILAAGLQTWRGITAGADRLSRAIAAGALGAVVAVAVHSLTDNVFVHDMGVHLAILLGMASAGRQPAPLSRAPHDRTSGRCDRRYHH